MPLRTAPVQPALDVNEVDDILFDFSEDIVEGETILDGADAPVVTCTLLTGDDPDPAGMLVGDALVGDLDGSVFTVSADGEGVVQRVAGQVADASYALSCVVTLSSGRKLAAACELLVVRLGIAPAAI